MKYRLILILDTNKIYFINNNNYTIIYEKNF